MDAGNRPAHGKDTLMTKHKRKAASRARKPRAKTPATATKQAKVVALLERPEGATIQEIVKATGWQPHTVRGAISGALKKKLGLAVTSTKEERGRVYRVGKRRSAA
jgi:hypothetical protein